MISFNMATVCYLGYDCKWILTNLWSLGHYSLPVRPRYAPSTKFHNGSCWWLISTSSLVPCWHVACSANPQCIGLQKSSNETELLQFNNFYLPVFSNTFCSPFSQR